MRTPLLVILFTGLLSTTASAHIELLSPQPRYPGNVAGENKACPCGVGDSNRLCNVEGDRSDPDRAPDDRVTTLTAGDTVTVRFDEYVGHSGRFRVAIDYDGADYADFNQNILMDIEDPAGSTGNTASGSIWEMQVTIPDMNCDNCTLQLIQMMDGDTANPVVETIGRSTYYTCADIKIVNGVPGADAGPPADGPDGGDPVDPNPNPEPSPASGSGCNVGGSSSPWALLGALSLLMLLGRQRRRTAVVRTRR